MFDTGAQFFTVRTPAFQSYVDAWIADGIVREWCRGFGPDPDGFPRYIGVEGMATIAAALVPGLDVHFGVEVADVDALDADAVVVTAPSDDYDEMIAILCVLDRAVGGARARAGCSSSTIRSSASWLTTT